MVHVVHADMLRQMPCGFPFLWKALRVVWKARMYERLRQGSGVDLALCTLLTLSSIGRRTRRRARLFCSGPYVWSSVLTI